MADMVFILDDGDGTITAQRERSWNTPRNKPGQLAKMLTRDAPTPPAGVPMRYWAWDGNRIVEAPQAVKDAVDAKLAADAQAALEQSATSSMEEDAAIRACAVEDHADYQAERNAINTLADEVLGVGVGPRLPVESLSEYATRRKDRYKAILGGA